MTLCGVTTWLILSIFHLISSLEDPSVTALLQPGFKAMFEFSDFTANLKLEKSYHHWFPILQTNAVGLLMIALGRRSKWALALLTIYNAVAAVLYMGLSGEAREYLQLLSLTLFSILTALCIFSTKLPYNPYRARLVEFYKQKNPDKLREVENTLIRYKGREELMFQRLAKKYGPLTPLTAGEQPKPKIPTAEEYDADADTYGSTTSKDDDDLSLSSLNSNTQGDRARTVTFVEEASTFSHQREPDFHGGEEEADDEDEQGEGDEQEVFEFKPRAMKTKAIRRAIDEVREEQRKRTEERINLLRKRK